MHLASFRLWAKRWDALQWNAIGNHGATDDFPPSGLYLYAYYGQPKIIHKQVYCHLVTIWLSYSTSIYGEKQYQTDHEPNNQHKVCPSFLVSLTIFGSVKTITSHGVLPGSTIPTNIYRPCQTGGWKTTFLTSGILKNAEMANPRRFTRHLGLLTNFVGRRHVWHS